MTAKEALEELPLDSVRDVIHSAAEDHTQGISILGVALLSVLASHDRGQAHQLLTRLKPADAARLLGHISMRLGQDRIPVPVQGGLGEALISCILAPCNPDLQRSAASALVRGTKHGWSFPFERAPALILAVVDSNRSADLKTKLLELLHTCSSNAAAIARRFCESQRADEVECAIRGMACHTVPIATALLCGLASRDREAAQTLLKDPNFAHAAQLVCHIKPPFEGGMGEALLSCIQPPCNPDLRLSAATALVQGTRSESQWSLLPAQTPSLILALIDSGSSAALKTELKKLLLTLVSPTSIASIAIHFCHSRGRKVAEVQLAIREMVHHILPIATALLCSLTSYNPEAAYRLLSDPSFVEASRLLDSITSPIGHGMGKALLSCIRPPCNPDLRLSAATALARGTRSGWSLMPAQAPDLISVWMDPGTSALLKTKLETLLLTCVPDGLWALPLEHAPALVMAWTDSCPSAALKTKLMELLFTCDSDALAIARCCARELEPPKLERAMGAMSTGETSRFAPIVITAALLKNPCNEKAFCWLKTWMSTSQSARGDVLAGALSAFMCLPDREVGSLLKIKGQVHGSVLHAAASVGDFEAFQRLVNVGGQPVQKNDDGAMPLDLVPDESREQFKAYIERLLPRIGSTRVGDGKAFEKAMGNVGTIVEVEWLFFPICSGGPFNIAKFHHSLVKLTVRSHESEGIYVLEKCEFKDRSKAEEEQWKHGVIISMWDCVCGQMLDSYAKLGQCDLWSAHLTIAEVRRAVLKHGPYDLEWSNCHHAAQCAYNYCARFSKMKLLYPDRAWTAVARVARVARPFARSSPSGCHPASMEARPQPKPRASTTSPTIPCERERLMMAAQLSEWIYEPAHRQPPPGSWDGIFFSSGSPTQWALLESQEMFALVFRGTTCLEEFMVDVCALPTELDPSGIRVHCGMWRALRQGECDVVDDVRSRISETMELQPKPLLICGHSLGGGYALLAALHLMEEGHRDTGSLREMIEVVTFGAPQVIVPDVASDLWLNLNSKTRNLINMWDPVPRLPTHWSWLKQANLEVSGVNFHTGSSTASIHIPEFKDYGHVGELVFIQQDPSEVVALVEATDKARCLKLLLEELPQEARTVDVDVSNSTGDVKLAGYHKISAYVQTLRELPLMSFVDNPAPQDEG